MDIQTINNEFYNTYVNKLDKIPFAEKLTSWILQYAPSPQSQGLEIGSGVGALANWMTQLGYEMNQSFFLMILKKLPSEGVCKSFDQDL